MYTIGVPLVYDNVRINVFFSGELISRRREENRLEDIRLECKTKENRWVLRGER